MIVLSPIGAVGAGEKPRSRCHHHKDEEEAGGLHIEHEADAAQDFDNDDQQAKASETPSPLLGSVVKEHGGADDEWHKNQAHRGGFSHPSATIEHPGKGPKVATDDPDGIEEQVEA